jgi:PGAP2IP, second transmembrane domain
VTLSKSVRTIFLSFFLWSVSDHFCSSFFGFSTFSCVCLCVCVCVCVCVFACSAWLCFFCCSPLVQCFLRFSALFPSFAHRCCAHTHTHTHLVSLSLDPNSLWKLLTLAHVWVLLLEVLTVWVVAYNFVPGGTVTRERVYVVLFAYVLLYLPAPMNSPLGFFFLSFLV